MRYYNKRKNKKMIKFLLLSFELLIKFLVFNRFYILFSIIITITYILIDVILSINGVNTSIKKLYKIIK